MKITEALQNLGLSEKEAQVYVALLKLGRGSAYAIAGESGLKKPTTYVILGELMKKGLANKMPRMRKQMFVPKPPDELFALAEERISISKSVLPQLMALIERGKKKPQTLFFEGMKSVREVFFQQARRMAGRELVGFYAYVENLPEVDLFAREYHKELARRDVRIRGFVPDHPAEVWYRKTDAEQKRTIKVVPFEEYSSDISVDIGDEHIMFFAPRDMQVTLIENERIAKTMRQFFEMLWKGIPEKSQGDINNAV